MSENPSRSPAHEKWARFRFSVVGPLLAAPPEPGELQVRLQELSVQKWCHPLSGQWVQYGVSTIERWYYTARNEKQDPVAALRRRIRSDAGQHPALSAQLREELLLQYQAHPHWSYQLHVDNLAVLVEQKPQLGSQPGYASVLRFMKAHGLLKRPRGPQLREPICQRPVAPGFSPRLAAGPPGQRPMGLPAALWLSGRSLPALLPCPMVSERRCRRTLPRAGPRLPEAGFAARPHDRQRSGHARRRDPGRAGSAGHCP